MELKKNTILQGGKYRIEKKLGAGSFGITYLASARFTTEGGLGKMAVDAKVCIKEFFMAEINSRKEDGSTVEGSTGSVFTNYRKKFRKEAENLAKLQHPNIVNVYDVFDENGTTYYAMQYIDGGNLDDYIIQNNPLDENEAAGIISGVCRALQFMHSRQMLHLDLKPKNIMRSAKGDIYLIDFGLSKQFNDNGEPESSTTIGHGTPGYAPLEQANYRKEGTFPATLDIYALGATIYKLLSGERPANASDILNNGFDTAPLNRNNRSAILISVIEKCMAPMKKDRYQSVDEVIAALPKAEPVKPQKSEIKQENKEIPEPPKPKDKKKKQKEEKVVAVDNSVKDNQENRKYKNFGDNPSIISLRLYDVNSSWCVFNIRRSSVGGDQDRIFKSVGPTKITKAQHEAILRLLDELIGLHEVEPTDALHSNLDIWYDASGKTTHYKISSSALARLINIIPNSKEYRLYRFLNNMPDYEDNYEEDDEDEDEEMSDGGSFFARIKKSEIWKESKMIISVLAISGVLIVVFIDIVSGLGKKKPVPTGTQNDYYQAVHNYTPSINEWVNDTTLQNIMASEVEKVLNNKSAK